MVIELYMFFIMVLTHEFLFFRSITSERNLDTLVKVYHLWEPM